MEQLKLAIDSFEVELSEEKSDLFGSSTRGLP